MITPNTTIRFLKVPFSPSQNNVLKFGSLAEQITYMESKIIYTMSNCTYQREGNGEFIRVGKSMDNLYNCNYVMFQNANFSDKYFYAFIDKMEYVNPSVTNVYIKMDSYQSFQFDFTLQNSFIDRQTFSTDYYNTLVDIPSTGDLKVVYEYSQLLIGDYFILCNADPTTEDATSSPLYYPSIGTYSMPVYMIKCSSGSIMSEIIQAISNKGRADRIQACYYSPVTVDSIADYTIINMPKGDLNLSFTTLDIVDHIVKDNLLTDITFNIPYSYTFKKELCYPYAKLEVVDKITGKSIELDISKFADPFNPTFKLMGSVSELPEYKLIPTNYNGVDYSIENALVVNPSCELPIFSNSYAKYLKDNTMSQGINAVMSGVSAIGSIQTGNVAGAIGSFANLANILSQDKVAKMQPNQVSGIKGDAMEYLCFSPRIFFRLKVMDENHMNIARNFWNVYGYPERKIGIFNNTSNKYNFIKTVDANITADTIPSEYQLDLENIFDKGVTIWNNNYLEYDII